jgi:hypothetical protein
VERRDGIMIFFNSFLALPKNITGKWKLGVLSLPKNVIRGRKLRYYSVYNSIFAIERQPQRKRLTCPGSHI